MEALRLKTYLESDTIHIPNCADFIGKNVEIIILSQADSVKQKNKSAFFELAGKIDIDDYAISQLRKNSMI